jgi:hypothetical protein
MLLAPQPRRLSRKGENRYRQALLCIRQNEFCSFHIIVATCNAAAALAVKAV